jgi:N-acetylglucosaminyl-diphospho-decaprenol L-rhamnosyltransferase
VDLSYCVVNTGGRELLLRCLGAIRDTIPAGLDYEVLVLDNASVDGSADAVRAWNASAEGLGERLRLLAHERRAGKAENDSLLMQEARGEHCLLLNEDSELRPGAVEALLAALRARPRAGAAGAQLLAPDGAPSACAWRLPGVGTAIAQALFVHRLLVTQSGGGDTRPVGWVQSAAMMVRRAAAQQVGWMDPAFFVYSDETDFCKRLRDAGWEILHVPSAQAVHHEQLTNDRSEGAHRRAVEFHRNRDLYMRKHHGPLAAAAVRALTAWSYAVRTLVAAVRPGQDAGWLWMHAGLALRPGGEGVREAAAEFNRRRDLEGSA